MGIAILALVMLLLGGRRGLAGLARAVLDMGFWLIVIVLVIGAAS